jgi:Spy/CpxP family protein refolding chaperone
MALAALAAAISLPVQAGDHGPGDHMDRIQQELNLSDQQAAQVKEIMKEQRDKGRALFENAADDREKARTEMQALHEETMARLGKVLNTEQMAKMERMHEERMAHMQERRGDRQEFIDELQLTEDQKSQVRQILKEQHDKKRALFDAEGDRASKRAQMEALHEETKTRLATVLNDEQLAKFEEAHEKRMQRHKESGGRGGKDRDSPQGDAPQ